MHYRENLIDNIANAPLHINVGSHSDFVDDETREIWISDQEFSGDFGYVGGETFQQSKNKFQGTAANIKLTDNEPLFQTMRQGLDSYKFNVPQGRYRVSLLLTEPNRSASTKNIYNLGSDKTKISEESRVFDILINGQVVEKELNLAADYGILNAVELDYIIDTEKDIKVDFKSQSGKAILSGIRLEKL